MKTWIPQLSLMLFFALTGCTSSVRLTPEQVARRQKSLSDVYPCLRATEAIVIDGKLTEPAWQQAALVEPFLVPVSLATPYSVTRAWMTHDDRCLYIAFEAMDDDIVSTIKEHDGPLYFEDVVEVFIKSNPKRDRYTEIEVSPAGVVLDAYFPRRKAKPKWYTWTCEGLLVASQIDGTLNQRRNKDKRWTTEIAIPFAALPELEGKCPAPGTLWTFTLARYDYSSHMPGGFQLISSSPLTRNVFCYLEDWRTLRFE